MKSHVSCHKPSPRRHDAQGRYHQVHRIILRLHTVRGLPSRAPPFGLVIRLSTGTRGHVGGSSRRDQKTGRVGHHRASTHALVTVHTELNEPIERCSGYDPSFEGV